LIYRATRDGTSNADFHKFVDNKGPFIVIGTSQKRNTFAGYATVTMDSTVSWKKDNTAMILNIDYQTRQNANPNSIYHLYTHTSYKAYFGNDADLVFDATTMNCANGGGTYFE